MKEQPVSNSSELILYKFLNDYYFIHKYLKVSYAHQLLIIYTFHNKNIINNNNNVKYTSLYYRMTIYRLVKTQQNILWSR